MEVVHITSETGWRGGEIQVFNLINGLSALGVANTLICPPKSILSKKLKGVDIYELSVNHPYNPIIWNKIRKFLKSFSSPLVHIHNPDAHTLAFLSGIPGPLILHRRTIFPIKTNVLTLAKYKSLRIKKIICISDAIKKYTASILGDKNLITIHDGIDPSNIEMHDPHEVLCKELRISADSIIIGNASALTPEKGWELFLEISKILTTEIPELHFVVVGEGVLKESLKIQVTSLGISSHVHFLGFKSDIRMTISGFDILLMPSTKEGLGTVILDAFAVQTPVVATNVGGIPELIIHNKTGLLAELNNKSEFIQNIKILLENADLRNQLIKNAANHLLHFSSSSMVNKTIEVYKSVF